MALSHKAHLSVILAEVSKVPESKCWLNEKRSMATK
jgi:hypothetical protein